MKAILSRIKNFRKTEQPEDDVTLVVVKSATPSSAGGR